MTASGTFGYGMEFARFGDLAGDVDDFDVVGVALTGNAACAVEAEKCDEENDGEYADGDEKTLSIYSSAASSLSVQRSLAAGFRRARRAAVVHSWLHLTRR